MSDVLYAWGRSAARHPWRVIAAWVLIGVAVVGSAAGFGREFEDSFVVPGLDSQQAVELQEAAASSRGGLTAQVVATPRDADARLDRTSPEQSATDDLEAALAQLPNVLDTERIVSADGRVALLRVQYPGVEQLDPVDLDNLKELVSTTGQGSVLQIEAGGDLFFAFEEPAAGVGELIGLIAAVIILLVAFGSVLAMGLPIGIALVGLTVSMTGLSLVAYLVDIPSFAPVIGAMVGLGVGIDYALFVVTRHREYLSDGWDVPEAAGRALATAGRSVIFAGGVVVIAILGLAVSGIPFMTAAGVAVSVVVATMVAAAITLLPALLGLAGHRINGLRATRRQKQQERAPGRGWQRWGSHVTAHAGVYAIAATVLLALLAAPALSLRLGFPDEGSLPDNRTERRAYDLVADGFGAGINGPLVIAVDTSTDADVVLPLYDAIRADRGVASVAPPEFSDDGSVATLVAVPSTPPQDDATMQTVERLRSDVFPDVLAQSPATAHVGGQTATWGDLGGRVGDRLPLFIAAVVLMSFGLLVLVFRSVLVPVKAALMNLLSIGASYGVMVMVFQWGWGKELIGLQETVPVIAFIPMVMFAILFGLSMDYEVFLLSRVREEYRRTGDNERSVVVAIARTGRVITSAALIMIAVFLGFAVAEDPATKMMGLGLATAVFLDATVVRMVLVPATMKLLGDANWWLPDWLDRMLPGVRHRVQSESGDLVGQDEADDEARALPV